MGETLSGLFSLLKNKNKSYQQRLVKIQSTIKQIQQEACNTYYIIFNSSPKELKMH